jgi:hypothetical protein
MKNLTISIDKRHLTILEKIHRVAIAEMDFQLLVVLKDNIRMVSSGNAAIELTNQADLIIVHDS